MKTDKDILDEFGKKLINETYDVVLMSVKKYINNEVTNTTLQEIQEYKRLFESLDLDQKNTLLKFFKNQLSVMSSATLKVFDDPNYKLVYEDGKHRVYLDKASIDVNTGELYAEPIIEGGWIDKYSVQN